MPIAPKVKFKENGERCPKNLQKARRLPECGVFDRNLLPFTPEVAPRPPGPNPKNPFKPYKMRGIPGLLDSSIVPPPLNTPPASFTADKDNVGGATGPGSQYLPPALPQDETNINNRITGRILHPAFDAPEGYRTIPVEFQAPSLVSDNFELRPFRNGSIDPVLDDLVRTSMYETAGIPQPIEDIGAGVFPQPPPSPPSGDPRMMEEFPERPQARRFARPSKFKISQESSFSPMTEASTEMTRIEGGATLRRRTGMRNVEEVVEEGVDVREQRGQKRRGEYFEIQQNSPSRARSARTSQLRSRADQLRKNMELKAITAKRFKASLVTSIKNRIAGVPEGYEGVVSDVEGIRLAQTLTGERAIGGGRPILGDIEMGDITGMREIDLGAAPLERVRPIIGRAPPKLSFTERIATARAGVDLGSSARGLGAAGAGFLAGMGVAKLMGGTDYTGNRFSNAAIVGGASGVAGDVVGRTALSIGQRSFARSAETAAAYAAARAGSAILRGGAEGLVIGAVTAPLDLLLNDALMNSGSFSHAGANTVSSLAVGVTTMATIGAISLAAAPETLGLSLIVGGVATLASAVFGALSGAQQDAEERRLKEEDEENRKQVISTAVARKQLMQTLPKNNFDFSKAVDAFPNKKALGIDDSSWSSFRSSSLKLFVPRPSNTPPLAPGADSASTPAQKKMNGLFMKYITHNLIQRACTQGNCEDLKSKDPGALSADEEKVLEEGTVGTWKPQADMQVEMSVQELAYTGQRIQEAKKKMISAWNSEQKLPSQLDSYLVQTAFLDPRWESEFKTAIKLDAQERVVDAYVRDQKKFEQLPNNIRKAASFDPEFNEVIHSYYSDMDSTATKLQVTIPQLIELQGIEGEAQRDRYQEMQFDNVKGQEDVVESARDLAATQQTVRDAGFYDLDQAYMETDPTHISQWKPTDSQILQAHSAGMNLNQYVEYMQQLSLGEVGDYRKITQYSDADLTMYGQIDFSHFKDEIQMAGYRPDLYLYNADTREIYMNPNAKTTLPTGGEFISDYTPEYLKKSRQEYADMVHGLNEESQRAVDDYNNRLLSESPDEYEKNKMSFTPMSDSLQGEEARDTRNAGYVDFEAPPQNGAVGKAAYTPVEVVAS